MTSNVRVHELKCWPEFFAALEDGSKTFELRKDDRGFHAGDTLALREWNHVMETYTGNELRRTVSYVLSGPVFGLMEGWVAMGLQHETGNSSDAIDAARYRYLRNHLGAGFGVKQAGGDPLGFAGPTLLDEGLDAARGAQLQQETLASEDDCNPFCPTPCPIHGAKASSERPLTPEESGELRGVIDVALEPARAHARKVLYEQKAAASPHDQAATDRAALADAHRMYEAEHGEPFDSK